MSSLPSKARLVAFYLPQFHPIPENNKWWGEGFTEWTNVRKAKPRFAGHDQPRLPTELGYYDLREAQTQITQAKLAKAHGIEALCYYHYWFNGKLLLERPLEQMLQTPEVDISFCLCWANENWTRRWDGLNREVLIEQHYDQYDAVGHAKYLTQAFADPRYLRVDGRPVFIYYRANLIPDFAQKLEQLQKAVRNLGFPPLFCCAMARGEPLDSALLGAGLEYLIDFRPAEGAPANGVTVSHVFKIVKQLLTGYVRPLVRQISPLVFDLVFNYKQMAQQGVRQVLPNQLIPCVFPMWDNSSRRQKEAHIMQNHDAAPFQAWLSASMEKVQTRPEQERFVFINAWNEWAEGCYLEPDQVHGRHFLEAVQAAQTR